MTFLVYDLAFGFLIHCECSRAKSSPANPFKIPQLHRPSSRFLSPLILHSGWQGCWSLSQQSRAKRQSYSSRNVHVIGRWQEAEAPPSLHLQRRRDSNSTRRGSREWNLQPLQISAAFIVVHFSERDRAAGCGWADAVWAQHLSAAICIALTFICSFGTDMNVFTGAVTQPLQSAAMCQQITSIKELLCCVAADPCCLLLLFCSGEPVVSQQCSRLVATIRRNRVWKNREKDVNLLSSVLSYIWVYENTEMSHTVSKQNVEFGSRWNGFKNLTVFFRQAGWISRFFFFFFKVNQYLAKLRSRSISTRLTLWFSLQLIGYIGLMLATAEFICQTWFNFYLHLPKR